MDDSAIIVHSLSDCITAIESGHRLLKSAPEAVYYAGCLSLLAIFHQAQAAFPNTPCRFILDCADDPHMQLQARITSAHFAKHIPATTTGPHHLLQSC